MPHYIPYWLGIAIICVAAKFFYSSASVADLQFMLSPVNTLVSNYTGESSTYLPEEGYLFSQSNILVHKACSGMHFWIIAFSLLAGKGVCHFRAHAVKWAVLAVALVSSYVLTLFANYSRIISSLLLHDTLLNQMEIDSPLLHFIEGSFVYLLILSGTYLLYHFSLQKYKLK